MCGGGGHSSYNASLSRPNVQKNSRAFMRGMGGSLKFEEKNARKTIRSTPKKKLGIGSPVLCTFYSPPTQYIYILYIFSGRFYAFQGHFLRSRYRIGDIVLVAKISNNILGVLEIPDTKFWARAYV